MSVPSGMIAIFQGDCPSGWTRVSAFDGKFLRGASSYGGEGGAQNHYHTCDIPEFDSDNESVGSAGGYFGQTSPYKYHKHKINPPATDTDTKDHLPPYINVVFCKKD